MTAQKVVVLKKKEGVMKDQADKAAAEKRELVEKATMEKGKSKNDIEVDAAKKKVKQAEDNLAEAHETLKKKADAKLKKALNDADAAEKHAKETAKAEKKAYNDKEYALDESDDAAKAAKEAKAKEQQTKDI